MTIAPTVLELDHEGTLRPLKSRVAGPEVEEAEDVEDAAACCPVEALAPREDERPAPP